MGHWLARRPAWLVPEDQVLLARLLVRRTEGHLLPRLLEILEEKASHLEPVLWMLAERHAGGRLWRERLWRVADRSAWVRHQWRRFAVLCGCTGDLTPDVARQAGIPDAQFSPWWGPSTHEPREEPSAGPRLDDPNVERRGRILAQLRMVSRVGTDSLSLAEQEHLALALLELGHHASMHRFLTQPPWSYKPALARTSPELQQLRDRLALRLHAWLLAYPARWTYAKPGLVRNQVLLLRGLPPRVPASQWTQLQLKPAVLAHLGASARERAPLRRRDIYLALHHVRQAERAMDMAALGAASWHLLFTLVPQNPQEASPPSSAVPTPEAPSARKS